MFENVFFGAAICCSLITGVTIDSPGNKILLAQTMEASGNYAIWLDGMALTKNGTVRCPSHMRLHTDQIETRPNEWQVRIRCEKK